MSSFSSSSSSGSETVDFYSDLTENGVDGGADFVSLGAKLGWALLVVAMIVLILGITLWQLQSKGIISYKDPSSTTANWLAYGMIIVGSLGVVATFIPSAMKTYQDYKNKSNKKD